MIRANALEDNNWSLFFLKLWLIQPNNGFHLKVMEFKIQRFSYEKSVNLDETIKYLVYGDVNLDLLANLIKLIITDV